MKHNTQTPLTFSHIILVAVLLFSIRLPAFAQKAKADDRVQFIDSIYLAAERTGLHTDSLLRFEFYFSDPDSNVLRKLSARLVQDTFEVIDIVPQGNNWKLRMTRHLQLSREAMEKLDARLRWLRYSFLADEYLGFAIKPRDPDPTSIPESAFHEYIYALSDDVLYWVSLRLVQIKNYPRAMVALHESLDRQVNADTIHFHLGNVLVATNEFNEGMAHWQEALRINPQYLEAHMRYAQLLFTNGFFKRALEHYQKADAIKPNDASILYHIAETLYHLGRYNESLTYAKRSRSLDKKNVYTKSLIKLLKEPAIKRLRRIYKDK